MKTQTTYSHDEVVAASTKYFDGDQLAAEVFAKKYALRSTEKNKYAELTPTDMHRRLAKEFARIEKKYPNPMSEDEIFGLLDHYKYVVPQGSPMSGIGNVNQVQSLSNCFVIDAPYDSYGGILFTDQQQAQIMKRRGGVGFDISTIRPKGLPTANAASTTDGIGVFMERFSNTCREVAQGGRRGALLLSISVHHPEIRTFIKIKQDKTKVTGANISIRVTNEFMNAVKNNTSVQLRFPVEKDVEHIIEEDVSAKELWDEIISSAHHSAEPGLLFWDNVQKNGPADAYNEFASTSTNPCLTGETLVAVADGRGYVSIKELADADMDVPVYALADDKKNIVIKTMRHPRLTGKNLPVYRVTLEGGHQIKATANHELILIGGVTKRVDQLQNGDQLMISKRTERTLLEMGTTPRKNNSNHYVMIESAHKASTEHRSKLTVSKKCEWCKTDFWVAHNNRERAFCSFTCSNFYVNKNTDTNIRRTESINKFNETAVIKKTHDQLDAFTKLRFELKRDPIFKEWVQECKKNNVPCRLGTKHGIKTWPELKAAGKLHNHRVISVEYVGEEDVYNGTVDDVHNFCIGGWDIGNNERLQIFTKNCGEITLSPYDSCRLLLLNLFSFVEAPFMSNASFDYAKFNDVVVKAQRLMDDLIDLELEMVDKILAKIEHDPEPDHVKMIEKDLWQKIRNVAVNGRRTGLGVTAVGDTLAALNIQYGSLESVDKVEEFYKTLAVNAYRSSIQMAKERGCFPAFDLKTEQNHPFIERILNEDSEMRIDYEKYGRRNIALTTTAPAGSVSTQTQTTSGIEPTFMVSYDRFRKINPGDEGTRVDRTDSQGDKWQKYTVYHHAFKQWMEATGKSAIEDSPYFKATANDIDWTMKIELQAAAQKWICHAISNTCNLPNDTSVDVVKDIYMKGWELGCKGVTVYRDGCRDGVLVASTPDVQDTATDDVFKVHHAPKRPEKLICDIKQVNIQGKAWTIFVGLLEGKPFEVMGGLSHFVNIPKKVKSGFIVKNRSKRGSSDATYDLHYGDEEDPSIVKDVISVFENPTHSSFTRTISLALRHGSPVQYVVEQLLKGDKESDMFSFSKVISRVLKSYIPEGTKVTSEKSCQECNSDALIYQEGCLSCKNCGWSRCN